MKTRTMIMLTKMASLAETIVEKSCLSSAVDFDGAHLLWGPVEDTEIEGYRWSWQPKGKILDLSHGLTREDIESCLTLTGVENAVYRALAVKAGVAVKTADWWYFNHC